VSKIKAKIAANSRLLARFSTEERGRATKILGAMGVRHLHMTYSEVP